MDLTKPASVAKGWGYRNYSKLSDQMAQKIRAEGLKESCEKVDRALRHQGSLFVTKVIKTELISWHYNNLLAGYFGIKKTKDWSINLKTSLPVFTDWKSKSYD